VQRREEGTQVGVAQVRGELHRDDVGRHREEEARHEDPERHQDHLGLGQRHVAGSGEAVRNQNDVHPLLLVIHDGH